MHLFHFLAIPFAKTSFLQKFIELIMTERDQFVKKAEDNVFPLFDLYSDTLHPGFQCN